MAVGYGERIIKAISVTPNTRYTITIGRGGKGGEGVKTSNANIVYGTAGENSYFKKTQEGVTTIEISCKGGVYNGSSNSNYSSSGSPVGNSSNAQGSTGGKGVDGYCILSYKVDKESYAKKMSGIPENILEVRKKDGSSYITTNGG